MTNAQKFEARLAEEYARLFEEEPQEYAYVKIITTPAGLAKKMTDGLVRGTANKDGKGIAHALKHFGVNNTYKAIKEFLQ